MAYIGRPPEYGGYEKQDITPDGSTTTFVLNYSVGTESSVLVSVAGVFQQPGTAYTLSGGGANIVFSAAPASGVTVFLIFLGYAFDAGVMLGTATITAQSSLGTAPSAADEFLIYDDSASALKKVTYTNLIPTTHGDVSGPGSSTDDALAKFDSTTGKIIQNSNATLTDAGVLTVANVAATINTAAQPTITSLGTIASLVATTADINAGTFDGIVGGTTPADGSFSTLSSSGAATLTNIDGIIGANTPAAITGTTISGTQVDITAQGDLRLQDTTGGDYVALQAAGTTTTYTVTLPAAVATTTGQALTSSDAGVASWSDVGDASLGSAQEWTAQQNFNNTALTFDATQDWALTANQVSTLTLTANTTFDAPTQMVDGAFYSLIIIQDGTGGWTASWPTATFKWAAGAAPTLTTTASAKDIFVWRSDGTNMYEVGRQLNVS